MSDPSKRKSNIFKSTRTRHFRTGQKKFIQRVLKCLENASMLLKTCSRFNPRGRHIYEFGVLGGSGNYTETDQSLLAMFAFPCKE